MKKAKVILYILVLLAIMIVAGCEGEASDSSVNSSQDSGTENNLEIVNVEANYIKYSLEESLYDDADLIVIAHTDVHFNDREHMISELDHENPMAIAYEDFYTLTPITIEKILKKPNNLQLEKGDLLEIIEPLAKVGNQKITRDNYLEMIEGEKYILYLKDNTYGEYGVINMSNGLFSLSDNVNLESRLSKAGIDIASNELVIHERMKEQVFERFSKEIKDISN